jgi:tetratricopeptide (TPR) repeat protein
VKKNIILILSAVFFCHSLAFADEAQKHFHKGHRFYLDSKSRKSEREFKKALKINPNLSDAYYYLSSICFKEDRYQEAVHYSRQAVNINPEDIKSLIICGLSLQQMGLYEEAIDTFRQANRVDSRLAPVHSALGLAYCAKGDWIDAEEEYDILKELDSGLAGDLLAQIERCRAGLKGERLP